MTATAATASAAVSAPTAPAAPAARWPYRMRDLCRQTGLSRQAIHHYIQQGLLPEGQKRGLTMAWYGEEHVARLRLIRRLQRERLLPLKTIKSLLDDDPTSVDPRQRAMLVELKSRLSGELAPPQGAEETVELAPLLADLGLDLAEVERMAALDLVTLVDAGGVRLIARSSTWLLELWSQIRAIGLTAELGFTVDDMLLYEAAVSQLFRRERELFTERLSSLPGARVAETLSRALPLIHAFIAHYHTVALREYVAALE